MRGSLREVRPDARVVRTRAELLAWESHRARPATWSTTTIVGALGGCPPVLSIWLACQGPFGRVQEVLV